MAPKIKGDVTEENSNRTARKRARQKGNQQWLYSLIQVLTTHHTRRIANYLTISSKSLKKRGPTHVFRAKKVNLVHKTVFPKWIGGRRCISSRRNLVERCRIHEWQLPYAFVSRTRAVGLVENAIICSRRNFFILASLRSWSSSHTVNWHPCR